MLSLSSCVQVESVANITRTNMDGLNNMNNTSNMSNTLLNLSKTQIKKQKTIKGKEKIRSRWYFDAKKGAKTLSSPYLFLTFLAYLC